MTDKELEKQDIERKREFTVCKSNDFIQDNYVSRTFSLMSARQIDALNFMISKIKPTDEVGQTYYFSIAEFSKVYNKDIQGGYTYKAVKEDLKAIASINDFVDIGNGRERQVKYFDDVIIDKGNGTIELKFHSSIYPYLYNLTGKKYYFPVLYQAPMKYNCSKVLYELLTSLKNLKGDKVMSIDYLRNKLGAQNYKRFPDFRRFVLEKAVEEINLYTDITVEWKPKKIGSRSITHIAFTVKELKRFEIEDIDGEAQLLSTTAWAARELNRAMVLDNDIKQELKELNNKLSEEGNIEGGI